MVKLLGIATLLMCTALTHRSATACPPAVPEAAPPQPFAVPPPAPPVVLPGDPRCPLVPVRVRCQSPDIPCERVVLRYVCRPQTPAAAPCPSPLAPQDPGHRPYYRGHHPRSCRPYRSYRSYRPGYSLAREPRVRPGPLRLDLSPYHPKSTPYLGLGGGFFSFVRPSGGFEHLQAMADVGAFMGWSFGSFFALELGLANTFFGPKGQSLGDVSRVGLVAVTLDTRLRLVRPSPRRWAVPYLQVGLGVYSLVGAFPDDCGRCKTRAMAHGGGVQAGGGVDFYLSRYLILGTRLLYRHLLMSQVVAQDGSIHGAARPTRLHGVSAGLTLTAFWSHL